MADEEEELLQLAIQQSLLEQGGGKGEAVDGGTDSSGVSGSRAQEVRLN